MSEFRYKAPERLTARLRIWRGTHADNGRYEHFEVGFENGDSVLDGLVRLRYGAAPDLGFQFSCFNANVCKECAIMIDGAIEYACIAKLKATTMQLDPVPEQHVLRDLIIDTRGPDRKGAALRHGIQSIAPKKER